MVYTCRETSKLILIVHVEADCSDVTLCDGKLILSLLVL